MGASLLALAKSIYYYDTAFSAFHGEMQVECSDVQTVVSILSSPVGDVVHLANDLRLLTVDRGRCQLVLFFL